MGSEALAADHRNASEVGHLLPRVLSTPGLLRSCTAYQDGVEFFLYKDGDVAAAQGHLSLLRLRRSLCDRTKGVAHVDQSIGSSNCGGESGVGDGGCYSRYGSFESQGGGEGNGTNQEQQESKTLPRMGEEVEVKGHGEREGGALLVEDMNFSHRAVDWAAAQGHLEVVRWLLETRDEGCTVSAVDGACWNGHDDTARWLVCKWGQTGSKRAIDYAASNGRLELVRWLSRQPGSTCTVAAMDGAAGGGHLQVLQWLSWNRTEGCSQAAFEMAAGEGHLDVIKWLEEVGLLRCSSMGLDSAAEGGHVHVLQWMLEHKEEYQCSSNAYGLAASRGRLEVCKWLHRSIPDLRCPVWAGETAAAAGYLEVVRWLHTSAHCSASLADLDEVARQGRKGYLPAMIWLSERGARASTAAVDRAAEAGHRAVVEFLLTNREEGCSSEAMIGAARNGHLCIVKLLQQLRPEQCGCCLAARSAAAAAGHGEIVLWLDGNDPSILLALQQAVMSESSGSGRNRNRSSSRSSSSSSLGDQSESSFFSACNHTGNGDGERFEPGKYHHHRRRPLGDEASGSEGCDDCGLLGLRGISARRKDQLPDGAEGGCGDAHDCAAAVPTGPGISSPAAALRGRRASLRTSRKEELGTELHERLSAAAASRVVSLCGHFGADGENDREQQANTCNLDGGVNGEVRYSEGSLSRSVYGDGSRDHPGADGRSLSAPASSSSRQQVACRDDRCLAPSKATKASPVMTSMAAQNLVIVLLGGAAGVAAACLLGAALCHQ
ncbi:unnamed protein product [Scytosiphon promiscuus]